MRIGQRRHRGFDVQHLALGLRLAMATTFLFLITHALVPTQVAGDRCALNYYTDLTHYMEYWQARSRRPLHGAGRVRQDDRSTYEFESRCEGQESDVLVGILKERQSGETRVAATPATVTQLRTLGYEVVVDPGAGVASSFPDAAYAEAGATVGNALDG